MKTLYEIKDILSRHKSEVVRRFKVKELGIFGSCVRGEQKLTSDIDILVDFSEGIGFFRFLELEEYLESLLGDKVDLVSRGALKPIIGRYILNEVEMV